MYLIKEMYGSLYCTDASNGDVLYELSEPAVLFSLDLFTIHKIGNKDWVSEDYDKLLAKVTAAGCADLIDDYVLADLPKDIEILNKVYNNSTYLKVLFKDILLSNKALVEGE